MRLFTTLHVCSAFSAAIVLSSVQEQLPLLTSSTAFNQSHFDHAVTNFMNERSIPGLSVALTYDDRLIFASGYGYANKNASLKVETTDRFRLASVSKSITAIAIMHLVQDRKLDLEARVLGDGSILGHTYGTKTFSDWERNITVQHLLEHSLGFVNEDMCGKDCDPTFLHFQALDQWQLVSAILDQYSPSYPPGTFADYSNFGYFLAGRVIEAASGVMPYVEYVKEQILEPMGIVNMTLAEDERQESEVVYYDFEDSKAPYNFYVHRRDSVGAWIASPTDLVKILTAVNGLPGRSDFLDEAVLKVMYTKSPIKDSDYAKGFVVREDEEGLVDASKAGGYPGTNSYVNVNFRNKTTYAIVVNIAMPKSEQFNGGEDLKALMDNLTFGVDRWPSTDMFEDRSSCRTYNSLEDHR